MTETQHGLAQDIENLRRRAMTEMEVLSDAAAASDWEKEYLGGKGAVTALLRGLGGLPAEERPAAGRATQALRNELIESFAPIRGRLDAQALQQRLGSDAVDVTLPGRVPTIGGAHPISSMIDELVEIFALLGFQAVFGPEVETGRYNFDLLNIPADHPARDVWDTIIVDSPSEMVLRTHTSPMQARTMERTEPPVRVIVPGRAFRFEAQDASHEWMFTQLEGLAVDKHITLADLKGVLQEMARQLFGPERQVRFRCDFFPFVEPGVDFAVDCAICNGKGCRVCKHTGWLEIGGAGMVHPKVLSGVGYDPEQYTGFAFGLGIERLIMMKYGVDDARAFAGNDLRFLRRFASTGL
ncbi:MAG TPA: phenylalanine--tRNA ligase subunit alpha [Thermomicrobiales bacterium]|nr:phenylalanine--tRNA ligase subunit alpha [Thermomicrobiales bacterium]